MKDIEELRVRLIRFIKMKFPNIRDPDAYEEIVNQSIINLRISRRYKIQNENFGYLSKICYNLAIKAVKEQNNEANVSVNISMIEHLPNSESIEEDIINEYDRKYILETLEKLRDVEKKVLVMRYYGSCSFAEISESTGTNLNTVLSHHRRALERLRPAFSKYFCDKEEKADIVRQESKSKYFKFL